MAPGIKSLYRSTSNSYFYIPTSELFTPEWVHSFQSDFWSFGCLLFELRRGSSPFGDSSSMPLADLIEKIRNIDPINSIQTNTTINNQIQSSGSKSAKPDAIPSMSAELAVIYP